MNEIQPLQTLGFVEAFPANPPFPPHADSTFGLVGLTRSLDARARRHRVVDGVDVRGVAHRRGASRPNRDAHGMATGAWSRLPVTGAAGQR